FVGFDFLAAIRVFNARSVVLDDNTVAGPGADSLGPQGLSMSVITGNRVRAPPCAECSSQATPISPFARTSCPALGRAEYSQSLRAGTPVSETACREARA